MEALKIAEKCLTGQADTVENLLLDSWIITAKTSKSICNSMR